MLSPVERVMPAFGSKTRQIALAVVGYTDELAEMLFSKRGVPVALSGPLEDEVIDRLLQLEAELERLREASG